MFTGIVEDIGIIRDIKKDLKYCKIKVESKKVLKGTKLGDSISVNGVCLTVTSIGENYFTADIVLESLKRSNLGNLIIGSKVNLERALSAKAGRFGGHIVSGHIDCLGEIVNIIKDNMYTLIRIKPLSQVMKYIVEKGSITIDGISLTIAYVDEDSFLLSIIPHTIKETNLQYRKVSDLINIECDIVGKYIESFIMYNQNTKNTQNKGNISNINEDFLRRNGFI